MDGIFITLRLSRITIGVIGFDSTTWMVIHDFMQPLVYQIGFLCIAQLRIQLHHIHNLRTGIVGGQRPMYGKDGTVVTDAEEMALTTLLGEV